MCVCISKMAHMHTYTLYTLYTLYTYIVPLENVGDIEKKCIYKMYMHIYIYT